VPFPPEGTPSTWVSSARPERSLAALFLLALVVRVGVAVRTDAIFNDGPRFLRLSELFAAGDWATALSDHYHPLYPLVTAAVSPLTGGMESAAIAVSILSGSIAVLALYAFVRWAFDARTAWIAGILLALHPYAAEFSAGVQSEGLYFAFFLSAVALLWRALQKGRAARALAAGALIGLAYLVRPEGLGLLAVAAVFALRRVLQGHWSLAASGRWMAALGLATALFAGPYLIHLRLETGQWMLTQKKSLSQLTNLDENASKREAAAAPRTRPLLASPLPPALLDPGPIRIGPSTAALIKLLRISQSALHLVVVALLILGLYRLRGRPGDRGLFLAAVVGLYALVLYGLARNTGYLDRRHVLAPLIPLFGYAATGVVAVATGWLARTHRSPATPRQLRTAVWACLGLVAALTLPKTLSHHREERLATRRAAEWLAEQADLAGPVAADKSRTAWYAGSTFVRLPRAGAKATAAQLYKRGARFLIVDEEQLERLGTENPDRLRELRRVEEAGRTAFVYQLSEAPASRPDPKTP
jgi:4-amino-4-deoxy-L-arabinose transferase-like glycosyltransferase